MVVLVTWIKKVQIRYSAAKKLFQGVLLWIIMGSGSLIAVYYGIIH